MVTCNSCPTQGKKRYSPLAPLAGLFFLAAAAYGVTAEAASRSISEWTSCTGTRDDTSGAMAAFAAAKNGAFTLMVDCPVFLHSGLAIDRGIFIDNETTVQFTAAGKFIVDNMFHPAFIIADSFDINLVDWNVEWQGSVPVNPNFGGYYLNGAWVVASSGSAQPAAAFNDIVLTNWLSAHRSVNFNESKGWIKSIWVGGVNPAAVFFITGQTSVVNISGLNLYVPANAGGDKFMPMAFSFSANWKSNQTVTEKTPFTAQYAAVPRWLTFSNIHLDGTYMGWQGNVQEATFENVTSARYGDLQDAHGGTVGGVGKWFPPPHLFYLNTQSADPLLLNTNITISSVTDDGPRVGVARDTASNGSSGYANSLKLGCTTCSVNNYITRRPDGFMDVLPSSGLTVSNVFTSFNSEFLNNLYPAGIRFPSSGYDGVKFENVYLSDAASRTTRGPIGNSTISSNNGIVLAGLQISMTWWAGTNLPLPTITGSNTDVSLEFTMTNQLMNVAYLETNSLGVTVKTTPTTINHGASTLINWSTKNASNCSATGAWSGAVGSSGTRAVKLASTGYYSLGLSCQNASDALGTTMHIVAQ
jgi:hypothetical protein